MLNPPMQGSIPTCSAMMNETGRPSVWYPCPANAPPSRPPLLGCYESEEWGREAQEDSGWWWSQSSDRRDQRPARDEREELVVGKGGYGREDEAVLPLHHEYQEQPEYRAGLDKGTPNAEKKEHTNKSKEEMEKRSAIFSYHPPTRECPPCDGVLPSSPPPPTQRRLPSTSPLERKEEEEALPVVSANPNCFVLHLFGITSGGALLDSYAHNVWDMTDTALVCSPTISESVLLSPWEEGSSALLSHPCPTHEAPCVDSTVTRKRKRSGSMDIMDFRNEKRREEVGDVGITAEVPPSSSFSSSPPLLTRNGTRSKTSILEAKEKGMNKHPSSLVSSSSLFSDIASYLPSNLASSLSPQTIPARNLLLYSEGNFVDVVAEAHYTFFSSIEPLSFKGTFCSPLRYPRSAYYHTSSRRRCGAARALSSAIWGKLCVVKDHPLLYCSYRDEGSPTGDTAPSSPQARISTSRVTQRSEIWKRWITELEVARRWGKSNHLFSSEGIASSFQVWIAPHNVYPQLGGKRVRLSLSLSMPHAGQTSKQHYIPLFHSNDFGIGLTKTPAHSRRNSQCSRYRILRAVAREFAVARKELRPAVMRRRRRNIGMNGEARRHLSFQSIVRPSSPSPSCIWHDSQISSFPESMISCDPVPEEVEGELPFSISPPRLGTRQYSSTTRCASTTSTGMQRRKIDQDEENEKKGIMFLPGGEISWSPLPTSRNSYWLLFHRFCSCLEIKKLVYDETGQSSQSKFLSVVDNSPFPNDTVAHGEEKEEERQQELLYPYNMLSPQNPIIFVFSSPELFSAAKVVHRYYEQHKKYLSPTYHKGKGFFSKGKVPTLSATVKEENSFSEADIASAWHYLLLHDEKTLFRQLRKLSKYLIKLIEHDYGMV